MTKIIDNLNSINTKEDLSNFISKLADDLKENKDEWENSDLHSFLKAMSEWVIAMESYYENTDQNMPENTPWKAFATIIYAAKIYE